MLSRLLAPVGRLLFLVLDRIVPKDTRIILFAGRNGVGFFDNSRYLFDYCQARPEFDAYWLTRSRETFGMAQFLYPSAALYAWSLRSLWLFLRAGSVVLSDDLSDVAPYHMTNGCKNVLLLTHGVSIKRRGLVSHASEQKWADALRRGVNYIIASSKLDRDIRAETFGLQPMSIWITGYPRNDVFSADASDMHLAHPYLTKTVIFYAPTYRRGKPTVFFPFDDLDFSGLNAFLETHDAVLLLRCDIKEEDQDFASLSDEIDDMERIRVAGHEDFPDVNELLRHVDILVTDYSSIYIDFLLLDRPIVFLPYDYTEFSADPGLVVDYYTHTPGLKAFSQEEFLEALNTYVADPLHDREQRREMRRVFHRYTDGDSTIRVTEQLLALQQGAKQ